MAFEKRSRSFGAARNVDKEIVRLVLGNISYFNVHHLPGVIDILTTGSGTNMLSQERLYVLGSTTKVSPLAQSNPIRAKISPA